MEVVGGKEVLVLVKGVVSYEEYEWLILVVVGVFVVLLL